MPQTRRLGWIPDIPDQRDFLFRSLMPPHTAPSLTDLRPTCPAPYDQGDTSTCVGQSTAGLIQYVDIKAGEADSEITPSRLFVYFNARIYEGSTDMDSGCQIRDAIKAVAAYGECNESIWPFVVDNINTRPNEAAYNEGVKHKPITYMRVTQTLSEMRSCLADGYPFIIGLTLYESFMSDATANSGVVLLPSRNERAVGGHAMLAVGYNDATQMFIVRNSWGSGWGDKGYCYIPYAYFIDDNLASDFWTIRSMT
jgi:C1A family cysteine protease